MLAVVNYILCRLLQISDLKITAKCKPGVKVVVGFNYFPIIHLHTTPYGGSFVNRYGVA